MADRWDCGATGGVSLEVVIQQLAAACTLPQDRCAGTPLKAPLLDLLLQGRTRSRDPLLNEAG